MSNYIISLNNFKFIIFIISSIKISNDSGLNFKLKRINGYLKFVINSCWFHVIIKFSNILIY